MLKISRIRNIRYISLYFETLKVPGKVLSKSSGRQCLNCQKFIPDSTISLYFVYFQKWLNEFTGSRFSLDLIKKLLVEKDGDVRALVTQLQFLGADSEHWKQQQIPASKPDDESLDVDVDTQFCIEEYAKKTAAFAALDAAYGTRGTKLAWHVRQRTDLDFVGERRSIPPPPCIHLDPFSIEQTLANKAGEPFRFIG